MQNPTTPTRAPSVASWSRSSWTPASRSKPARSTSRSFTSPAASSGSRGAAPAVQVGGERHEALSRQAIADGARSVLQALALVDHENPAAPAHGRQCAVPREPVAEGDLAAAAPALHGTSSRPDARTESSIGGIEHNPGPRGPTPRPRGGGEALDWSHGACAPRALGNPAGGPGAGGRAPRRGTRSAAGGRLRARPAARQPARRLRCHHFRRSGRGDPALSAPVPSGRAWARSWCRPRSDPWT